MTMGGGEWTDVLLQWATSYSWKQQIRGFESVVLTLLNKFEKMMKTIIIGLLQKKKMFRRLHKCRYISETVFCLV